MSKNLKIVLLISISLIVICGLITTISIIALARFNNDNQEVKEEKADTDLDYDSEKVETIVFSWPDGDELFAVTMDKSLVIDEFKMSFSEAERYIEFRDNPNRYASSDNAFTYFPTENDMTEYFQYENLDEYDYALTYPVPEIAKTHNEDYIYYDTEDDGVTFGRFYDWNAQTSVKDYSASHIVSYTNYLPENMDTPFFTENSARGNSYCVIDLLQLDEESSITGYLVFFGLASAGSSIDFCETLDELEVFEIEASI